MTASTKVPLGAETVMTKWYVDVDTTPTGPSATWVPIFGITNFAPVQDNGNLEDDSDYDSGGFMSQVKTATAHSATMTVARKVQAAAPTQYDPGQEYLRTASIGQVGNQVHLRYYEMTPAGPRVEAYAGFYAVQWGGESGAMKDLSSVQVTLTGRGKLLQITHPDTASAVVPVVGSLTPATGGTAGGGLTVIKGTAFTGATAVTYGSTAATNFTVISDSEIVATIPAHASGTVQVSVTNATGVSTVTQPIVYS